MRIAGRHLWIFCALLAAALAVVPGRAQTSSTDLRAGLELAREQCASCHAVERGNRRSVNPDAPAFSVVAAVPGMSGNALQATLLTPHPGMPAIVLNARQRADLVAYILSLAKD